MTNIERLISEEQRALIATLYKSLGWTDEARQQGFNRRIIGRDAPLTNKQGNKIVQAQRAMLMARVQPHYSQVTALVETLYTGMAELAPWERTFIQDIQRKVQRGVRLSPRIINKVREVAHHHDVDCGFPSFRELAAAKEGEK